MAAEPRGAEGPPLAAGGGGGARSRESVVWSPSPRTHRPPRCTLHGAGPSQSHQPHPRPGDPESRGRGLGLLHSVSDTYRASQAALPTAGQHEEAGTAPRSLSSRPAPRRAATGENSPTRRLP